MVLVNEEKRIIFGWIVDFLCWDGLNDFLCTLNTNSIMRTLDLLNGCLASTALTLMDEVPYRRHMASLIAFLTKICSGNNHRVNAKCKETILETAVHELQQLKHEIPQFEDMEFKLKIHAVIVCCTADNFVLANEVYQHLDLKSFIHSKLINESDRELLHTVRDILSNEDVNHKFLKDYSYESFILMWVPLFQDVFKNMREPHLVEMCRGMIGNNRLIAIGAHEGGKKYADCIHQMHKAIHSLNITTDISELFVRRKPEPTSSFFTRVKGEWKDSLNYVTSESERSDDKAGEDSGNEACEDSGDEACVDSGDKACEDSGNKEFEDSGDEAVVDSGGEAVENQNSCQKDPSSLACLMPIRNCQVLCVPLEKDTNLPFSLRNLVLVNNKANICLNTSVSEDDEIQIEEVELCENNTENIGLNLSFSEVDQIQNVETELTESRPTCLHNSFSEDDDNETQNERMELEQSVEIAVARICGEALPTGDELGVKQIFGSLSSLDSIPTDEATPVHKQPKSDLTLDSRFSTRTTVTPTRKRPPQLSEEKKKVPRISDEEDNLLSVDSIPTDEATPVRKLPKLDLTMGSRFSKRTTLTPARKHPLKLPEEKKKVPWTSEEEDNLYYGIRVYGEGNWERIRCQFNLMHRNGCNLSDKWRNLKNRSGKILLLKKRYLQKLKEQGETNKAGDSPIF